MGVLQLEVEGRPDGERPHDCPSLLSYFQTKAREATDESNVLDEDDCEDLFQEAWQYYQRYLSLFYLEDFTGVVRDTQHNLEIFELVQSHADSDEAKWYFEQYYPHAVMMRARSRAMLLLEEEDYPAALTEVEEGIDQIERFVEEWEGEIGDEELPELSFLRDWYEELEKERPLSHEEELERDLTVAVDAENFEEAAKLRDKLRMMRPVFRSPNPKRSSSST